jgi:hypothetical protein
VLKAYSDSLAEFVITITHVGDPMSRYIFEDFRREVVFRLAFPPRFEIKLSN